MHRLTAIFFAAFFIHGALRAGPDLDTSRYYLEANLRTKDSEELEKKQDYQGALEGYEYSYTKLLKIQTGNPEWEKDLVQQRMKDLKAKIIELQPKVPSSPEFKFAPEKS